MTSVYSHQRRKKIRPFYCTSKQRRLYNSVILFDTTAYAAGAVALIAFRVRRSRGEMYIGHARLCVCLHVCLSLAAFPHYCTNPDVTWGNGIEVPCSCALLGGFAIGARVSLL